MESKAFASYSSVPRVWKRFVYDVIAVVKKDGGQHVLQLVCVCVCVCVCVSMWSTGGAV